MSAEGYVKLHRQLLDSEVWENPRMLKVFIWALLRANYTERAVRFSGEDIILGPGQFISGRFTGAGECGLPPSTFVDQISRLDEMGMLQTASDNRKTVFTVVNWARYQGQPEKSDSQPTTGRKLADTDKKRRTKVDTNRKPTELIDSHLFANLIDRGGMNDGKG
jgi:hypothetical protein